MATQTVEATVRSAVINGEADGTESLTITLHIADVTSLTLATGLSDRVRPVNGGGPQSWASAVGDAIDIQYDDATFLFVGMANPA
jgi:hypothetical protein